MNDSPEDTLRAYVRAFETLDPDSVMTFYHLPSMFIAPWGVSVISNAEAARGTALALIEHARSQDYRRSEIVDLKVTRLANNITTLSGVFFRFNSKEIEISRFGFAYTMFHDGTNWKIAVGLAHDPLS